MANEQKIIDISVNYSKAVNDLIETKNAITKLRVENVELSKDMATNGGQVLVNNAQIKNLTATLNQNTKAVQDEVLQVKGAEGAYQKLNLQYQLSAQKAKDIAASQGVNSAASIKASKEANDLNEKLKAIDKTVGQNQRSVGDYGIALGRLPGIFGEMQEKGQSVLVALRTKFDSVKDATMSVRDAMLAQREAVAQSMLASEKAAIAEQALATAEAEGAATAGLAATAEEARAAATASATVATEAGATAMKVLKFAIASTGIGILVIALGAVVSYFTSTNEGAKKFQQVMNGVNAVIQSGVKIMGSLGKLIVDVLSGNTKELAKDWDMVKGNIAGATTEIGKNYKAAEQNTKNQQMMAKREREWSGQRLALLKEYEDAKIMASKRSSLDDSGKEAAARKALKINENIFQNDLKIARNKAKMVEEEQKLVSKKDYQAIQDSKNKVQEIINTHSQQQLTIGNLLGKTEQRIEASDKAAVKSAQDAAKARAAEIEKEIEKQKKASDEEIKMLEKKLSVKLKSLSDDLQLSNLIEDEKLAGKIKTDAEWLKIDNDKIKREENNSLEQLNRERENSSLTYNIIKDEKEKILKLNKNADISALDDKMSLELDKQSEIEDKKEIIIQTSKTKIAKNNAAADAKIKADELQAEAMALDNEFELAKNDVDRQLQLTYDKLEAQRLAEVTAANGNAELIIEINRKFHLADIAATEEATKKKIENVYKYADAANNVLSQANSFSKALGDAELANWAKTNKGKANFDAEYAKKKAKLDHDAAVRSKALNLFGAILATAKAITEALPNIPLSILAGAAGALQIGTIIATPIPEENASSSSNSTTTTLTTKLHDGGVDTPDSKLKSDEITRTLLKSERVLSPVQTSIFDNIIRNVSLQGGSNNITSNIGTNQIDQSIMIEAAMSRAFAKMPPTQLSLTEWNDFQARQLLLEENRVIK